MKRGMELKVEEERRREREDGGREDAVHCWEAKGPHPPATGDYSLLRHKYMLRLVGMFSNYAISIRYSSSAFPAENGEHHSINPSIHQSIHQSLPSI